MDRCDAHKGGDRAAGGRDVVGVEPRGENEEMLALDNCITTGHIGAATEEAIVRLRCAAASSAVKVLSGICPSLPSGVANPQVLEKLTLKPE